MGNRSSEPQRISIDRESFNIAVTPAAIEEFQRVSNKEKYSTQVSNEEETSSMKVNNLVQEAPNNTNNANDILKTNEQIKILQENYEKRLESLEKKTGEIFEESAEEFKKSLERVEKKFLHLPKSPCCQSLLDAVEKCYLDNRNKVLSCSVLVKDYNTCVNEYREAMLVKYTTATATSTARSPDVL